jgi:hypothetical protein
MTQLEKERTTQGRAEFFSGGLLLAIRSSPRSRPDEDSPDTTFSNAAEAHWRKRSAFS